MHASASISVQRAVFLCCLQIAHGVWESVYVVRAQWAPCVSWHRLLALVCSVRVAWSSCTVGPQPPTTQALSCRLSAAPPCCVCSCRLSAAPPCCVCVTVCVVPFTCVPTDVSLNIRSRYVVCVNVISMTVLLLLDPYFMALNLHSCCVFSIIVFKLCSLYPNACNCTALVSSSLTSQNDMTALEGPVARMPWQIYQSSVKFWIVLLYYGYISFG